MGEYKATKSVMAKNLNLYFKLKFYYRWRNVQLQAETASHNPLAEALIGYKVLPVWWMELSYLHGNMRYYNEVDTHSIYLFGCDPKFRVSWLNILPIKDNFSINLSYRLFSIIPLMASVEPASHLSHQLTILIRPYGTNTPDPGSYQTYMM